MFIIWMCDFRYSISRENDFETDKLIEKSDKSLCCRRE